MTFYKKHQKEKSLLDADRIIRTMLPVGMIDGTRLKIEFISGFEIFGAYENWRQGYRVTLYDDSCENIIAISVKEYLDDAIEEIKNKR